MAVSFHADAPEWFALVPEDRAGHWVAAEGYRPLLGNVLSGYLVCAILKSGHVIQGTVAGTRGTWTGIPFLAIHIEGRRKLWFHVDSIAEVWSDRGQGVKTLISRIGK